MTGISPDQAFLDLVLLFAGYSIAILSRFRIIIILLQTVVFAVKIYQWITKNRVHIDERLQKYIGDIRAAEGIIFPVIFRPFYKGKKLKEKQEQIDTNVEQLTTEQPNA